MPRSRALVWVELGLLASACQHSGPVTDGGRPDSGASSGVDGAKADGIATDGVGALQAPHALAVTSMGACALTRDGTLLCWGYGGLPWTLPSGPFSAIYGGGETVCAVRSDGSASCFGDPYYDSYDPQPVSRNVTSVAVATGAVCGLDQAGQAFCDTSEYLPQSPPQGEEFLTLSIGIQFGCGIRSSDQSIACWAGAGLGNCDHSPPAGQLDAPAGAFTALASGAFSTCAIATDKTLHCWGLGTDADPSTISCFEPWNAGQSLPPTGQFRAIAVSISHACAIRDDGTLACWGAGTADKCGGGIDCRQSRPPTGTFEEVGLGFYHSCAVTTARKVVCWGFDQAGLLDPPAELQ
jgi:Regulator of chromosome condensation (RCC1) repeat